MKEKIKRQPLLLIGLILFSIFSNISNLYAQGSEEEILNNLVNALNNDVDSVYEDYYDLSYKLETTEDDYVFDQLAEDFFYKLGSWDRALRQSSRIYEKYIHSSNADISRIANIALSGAKKGIEAITNYNSAFEAITEEDFIFYFERAEEFMNSSVELHDSAVDLYNDYTGISEALSLRNWLIFGFVVSIIASVILFSKSRISSGLQAEITRAEIHKGLFQSSLWMTAGLLITTITYLYAFEYGGSYFILYGPVLVGGWQLLKGLSKYLTKDRHVLKKLASSERDVIIKKSYGEPTSEEETKQKIEKIDRGKKCPHCGRLVPSKTIVCYTCGENVL